MNKYRQTLVKNIRTQLELWLNKQASIDQQDLYRFLHSIAGTAATIGLTKAGDKARYLMEQLNENEQKIWTRDQLQDFLLPLISVFYDEEVSDLENVVDQAASNEQKKLILLIDDDPSLIMQLKNVLEENGWYVLAVADPERAVQALTDLNPDCVVINFQIKGKRGHEVLRKLREEQMLIPIVMINSYSDKNIRIDSYRLGADDFIQTPFDVEELIVRIHRNIRRKQAVDDLTVVKQRESNRGSVKRQIHIGIVDDDPIIRTILTDMITKSKITEGLIVDIRSFKDGMEFYDSNWYSESNDPYLIVLDGMMPRMDGIEVLQHLRGLPEQEKYTIMMLTSRKSGQDIARAIELGADDYITKPFKLLELETRLGHLIKRMK